MIPDGTSGKRRPVWVTVAWLASPAVLVVVFAIVWVVRGTEPARYVDSPDSSSGGQARVCVQRADEGDYCDRLAREWAGRSSMTRDDSVTAQHSAEAIERHLVTRRLAGCTASCANTLPSAGEIRAWLVDAGHDNAVARIATEDDPAPAGSIVYAVRIGSACVVGHLSTSGSTARALVLGRLPNGDCLKS